MPQYDYHCEKCSHEFMVDLSMAEHEEKDRKQQIHCPKCDSRKVRHLIQSVFVMTSKKS